MRDKNNYQNYILYAVLAVIAIGFVLSFTGVPSFKTGDNDERPAAVSKASAASPVDSRYRLINIGTTGEGDVSIELRPIMEKSRLILKASINTHSVDLSPFDLKQITTLELSGKSVNPVSAPKMSGHHITGDIVFNIDEEVDDFVVRIKGIPKVEERVFEWR